MATVQNTAPEAALSALPPSALDVLGDDPLPSWAVLVQRLEEQRQALWRAAAIVQCVAATANDSRDPVDGTLNGNQAKDIELALMAAHGIIEGATGALEPAVLLAPEEPEAAEEAQS